jgi:hypothetical protein
MTDLCWSILARSLGLNCVEVAGRGDVLATALPCRGLELVLKRIIVPIDLLIGDIKLLIVFLSAQVLLHLLISRAFLSNGGRFLKHET